VGREDGSIHILALRSGQLKLSLRAHHSEIRNIRIRGSTNENNSYFLTCSSDSSIRLWNLWSGEVVKSWSTSKEMATMSLMSTCLCCTQGPDLWVACGAEDGAVRTWHLVSFDNGVNMIGSWHAERGIRELIYILRLVWYYSYESEFL